MLGNLCIAKPSDEKREQFDKCARHSVSDTEDTAPILFLVHIWHKLELE